MTATIPRGPRLRLIVLCGVIGLVTLIVGLALGPRVHTVLADYRASSDADLGADGTWYISQMHPWIIQPEPGQCPVCGMDLTPVDPDLFEAEIAIDPVVVQNMGVRVARAETGALSRSVRTLGTVTVDEARVSDVVQRFGGWVEEVFVEAQWDRVVPGQKLMRVYAPAVLAAEQEYLAAQAHADDAMGARVLKAARQRLELLGLDAAELKRLDAEGVASDTLVVRSAVSGYVWEKNVNRGSQIMPQSVAYRIANLDQVWIEATIYQQQAPFVAVGSPVRIQFEDSRAERTGTVAAVYPQVDAGTRELTARIVLENGAASELVVPGQFVTLAIAGAQRAPAVLIPREAVIGTGERRITFVSLGRGKFEPREVELGALGDDGRVEVLAGVEDGELVVTSGQFLLDSESRMREALAKVMRGTAAGTVLPEAPASASIDGLPASAADAWRRLIESYLVVQDLLYRGEGPLAQASNDLLGRTRGLVAETTAADEHFLHRYPLLGQLRDEVTALDASSPEALRPGFGAVGITLSSLLQRFGQPAGLSEPIAGWRCGMFSDAPDKGVWIQAGAEARNPFYGASSGMHECAVDQWSLPAAATAEVAP
ncbi:MAG: efflux RND transporter periplasmic adaptor subunit [Planctomycetota bacterium]|jgi:Cu(I)/Ag(I) efflux system membrane fusion protein|nr:efflux RND transporter periplasmic adaptor subunit [Planctomycetota bacterium]